MSLRSDRLREVFSGDFFLGGAWGGGSLPYLGQ